MSKQIAQDITALVNKWAQVRVAYPVGWSDEQFVASEDISYKTYLADHGSNAYKVVELKIKGTPVSLTFWSREDGLVVETPITKPVSAKAILAALHVIYTEATSIENIAEGKVKLRKDIADLKSQIKSKLREVKKLEAELEDK